MPREPRKPLDQRRSQRREPRKPPVPRESERPTPKPLNNKMFKLAQPTLLHKNLLPKLPRRELPPRKLERKPELQREDLYQRNQANERNKL